MMIAWIDFVKFLAAYAVIVIHQSSFTVLSSSVGSDTWWAANIYDSMARWCVPAFVCVSGYLLSSNNPEKGVMHFYKRRLSKIAIPLVFWTIFFIAWSCLRDVYTDGFVDKEKIYNSLKDGKPYFHMWYLYMLLGLYAAAPFINIAINKASIAQLKSLVIASVVFLFAYDLIRIKYHIFTPFILNFILYTPYYLFGAYLKKSPDSKVKKRYIIGLVFCISAIAYLCYLFAKSPNEYISGFAMYSYNNIVVAASALMIVKIIKDAKITNIKSKAIVVASSLSFGIYLIHPIFIDALNVLHIDTKTYNAYYFIPLSAALIFLISAICVYIASRLPWLNKVV